MPDRATPRPFADCLAAHPLVRDLGAAARESLVRRAVERRAAADEVLWIAGAEPGGLVLLLEGEVRVVRAEGGRQHVIHVEQDGGTLGEVPLFSGGRYPATAIASRPSRLGAAGDGAPVTLGAAQREIAEELGTVREVLVRALRDLRERGLIAPAGRGRFTVRDRAGLARLTRGEG